MLPELMKNKTPLTINLALQGGGSHGALTWGVLDALLEDGGLTFDGISGTSAGAMNAIALADGFAKAAIQESDPVKARILGHELARQSLRDLWEGVGAMGSMMLGIPLQASPWLAMMNQYLSPYQTNPLDINPLRNLLLKVVNFDNLCNPAVQGVMPKLFICATNVRTGRGHIFTGQQVSADAIMASACLPQMFKAVEIDGEHYWDGGFTGNPALYPLIYDTDSSDILLVQINPIEHNDLPDSASDITERMNEVTFNSGLLAELRAIEFVGRMLEQGRLDSERYKNVLMHRIDGGEALKPYGAASKARADLSFVRELFALGRERGQRWLQAHRSDLGVRSTLHIKDNGS